MVLDGQNAVVTVLKVQVGVNATAHFEGLSITRSAARGVIVKSFGQVTFKSCLFYANVLPSAPGKTNNGGMWIAGGTVELIDCLFRDNIGSSGAAVYVGQAGGYATDVTLSECELRNNTAAGFYGGGLRVFAGAVEVVNVSCAPWLLGPAPPG